MDIKIIHDQKNHIFKTSIDDKSCLNYKMPDKNVINFYHTFVPDKLRGQGIAAKLVEAGLKYAEKNKFRVIPDCSYVKVYIERNEKYKSLLKSEKSV